MDVVRHSWKSYLNSDLLREFFQSKLLLSLLILLVIGSVIGLIATVNSDQETRYGLQNNKISLAENVILISQSNVQLGSEYAKRMNNVLLAELYSQFGEVGLSAKYYQKLLTGTDNPEIARRATILAASSAQPKEALEAVRVWVKLSPNNLEARQYYSLLLLRSNSFEESVEQLHLISQFIDKQGTQEDGNNANKEAKNVYSKGLKFIGSMLNIESHHDQSLLAFQYYLKKYNKTVYQSQQNLIMSSLAMNAKKYEVVLSALKNVESNESIHSSRITLMKVKALQALNRVSEAVKILQNSVDQQQASDSMQLQLVRLLILDRQKNVASPYLKELVRKYPDNNDLLKTLIALEIDQSHLQSAKKNIQKLSKHKGYQSDVSYFKGEISEAEGDLQSALKNYQQVVGGSLHKRARKKIIKLGDGLSIRKVNYNLKP